MISDPEVFHMRICHAFQTKRVEILMLEQIIPLGTFDAKYFLNSSAIDSGIASAHRALIPGGPEHERVTKAELIQLGTLMPPKCGMTPIRHCRPTPLMGRGLRSNIKVYFHHEQQETQENLVLGIPETERGHTRPAGQL